MEEKEEKEANKTQPPPGGLWLIIAVVSTEAASSVPQELLERLPSGWQQDLKNRRKRCFKPRQS